MVYLLKIVIFHVYVSHNQIVILGTKNPQILINFKSLAPKDLAAQYSPRYSILYGCICPMKVDQTGTFSATPKSDGWHHHFPDKHGYLEFFPIFETQPYLGQPWMGSLNP